MDLYTPLEQRDLPEPPHWSKALGVGIVVMGLAMGTGELILWPHLVTKHGLVLLWMALVGISCQYFINQACAKRRRQDPTSPHHFLLLRQNPVHVSKDG